MAGPDPSRITDRLLQQNRPTGDIPRSLGSTAPASSAIAQYFAPITEKDAQLLQVLIGQIGQDREINAVFGKTCRVLGHAELFEPVRYQLHRGPSHEDEGIREFIR